MTGSSTHTRQRRSLVCPHCDEQFSAYESEMTPQCPRCGRMVKTLVRRRMLRIAGLSVLIAGIIILVAVYVFNA